MTTKFLNVSTDSTLSENSNVLVPSQKAVRNFIASKAVQLDFLQSTSPTTYSTGQKWLNTASNLLYTAISNSSWGTGIAIQADQFFTFNDLLYYYDGTNINSYSTLSITEQNAGAQIKHWLGTRAQYEALTSYDTSTLYEVIEPGANYALLASQTQFNNSSTTTAATPYQVKQELGNYLAKSGGNLDASAVLRLTNSNNEVTELAFDTNGYLTVSTGLYVTNALDVNSIVVRSGNVYKTSSGGVQVAWTDTYATANSFGVVKPDGTTITANNGVISAAAATSDITASSFSLNESYVKFSNGLILQYGYSSIPQGQSSKEVTFPQSFLATTTNIYTVTVEHSAATGVDERFIGLWVSNRTATKFTVNTSDTTTAVYFSWFAIGKYS